MFIIPSCVDLAGRPTLLAVCCKVYATGKTSQQSVHLPGVRHVLSITRLHGETASAVVLRVIMDAASGSKQTAGDKHEVRVDTTGGETASA